MPDGNMQYYGDQANVLPSNENALIHFSQQFAEQARLKQIQKMRQQQQDDARRMRVQSFLGNRLNNKEFETNADYQKLIDSGLQNISAKAQQELAQGVPEDQVMGHINDGSIQLKENARKVNELHANIAASVAQRLKENPGLDGEALTSTALHNAYYNQDKDGNYALKDPSQLDPSQNYVADAYHDHYPDMYTTEAQNGATTKLFDQQKLQDANENPVYDAKHNLVTPGYKGKLSGLVTIKKDAKGNTVYENGKPAIDVSGATNYRMPDQETDYVDENGKNVPVVNDDMYRQYYRGALGSGIEKQVRDQIDKANATGLQLGYDSPYADMLRKNILYQNLKGEATNRYKFDTPLDKSSQLKHQAFSERMAQIRAGISEHNSQRADRSLSDREAKDGTGDTPGVTPLTDKYAPKAESILNPLTNQPINYIDVNKIDKGDLHTITNNKSSLTGANDPTNTMPFEVNGKKIYVIDDKGDWYGQDADGNPKVIDKDAAFQRQVKAMPKSTPKRNIVQKVIDKIAPKKSSKIQGIEEGGLN